MAVRPDVPWYWRSLASVAAVVALLAGGWILAQAFGSAGTIARGDAERELAHLKAALERQAAELTDLRALAAQSARNVQIDGAAAADLAKQVKALTFENAALKEDLAFFQSLMSGSGVREDGLSVNRFRLQPEAAAGEYRYQMLLVQNGQRAKPFHGRLELILDVQHDGRKIALVLPAEAEGDGRNFELEFRFFQRIEGTFRLMPGAVLKGMQVRVFENGTRAPKLTQTLGLS
jgi:hypothetical protein